MTALNIVTDSTKVEEIKKAIGGSKQEMRVVFAADKLEDATKAFDAAAKAAGDSIPVLRPRKPVMAEQPVLNEKGKPTGETELVPTGEYEPDDSVFDSNQIAVAVVGARVRNETTGKMDSGIRAIAMFPIPSLDAFLDNEEGRKWLDKLAEKEASHVGFRGLRNAESLEELLAEFDSMPRDVDTFVSSARGEGLDTETFDSVWLPMRAQIKQASPKLAGLLPPKAETLRAIRSKAYAEQDHAELESNGIFVWLGQQLIQFADAWKDEKTGEPQPLDTSEIKAWLEGRDSLDLSKKAAETKDFSALAEIKASLGF